MVSPESLPNFIADIGERPGHLAERGHLQRQEEYDEICMHACGQGLRVYSTPWIKNSIHN